MKLPVGKIKRDDIAPLFEQSMTFHVDELCKVLAEYEPNQLYSHWNLLVRSIDEIINISLELDEEDEIEAFMQLDFNFMEGNNIDQLKKVLAILTDRFNADVATRFRNLALMCFAIDTSYKKQGFFDNNMVGFRLNTTGNAIVFFQSRRAYYVTLLNLIPKVANGTKQIKYIDILNYLQFPLDGCMIGITTAFYNLLFSQCLTDFEMQSDGHVATRNFEYDHLEGFFMEPQRLSLLDQMELRPDIIALKPMLDKADNKVFSFSEVANTMTLFQGAFEKYKVENTKEYKQLTDLFVNIAMYLQGDHDIIIDEDTFEEIAKRYPGLELYNASTTYFNNLNSVTPFQKSAGRYYTTVVLLSRFVYQTLSHSLLKNRSFQINSGFVFEDKVAKILEEKGFKLTNITRINHKEFDLITTKDGKVHNFQCKNNVIDIATVRYECEKLGRLNQRLIRHYDNALIKEEKREKLIQEKLGIADIEHYVISRYPVITRNKKIINFTNLDKWKE